MARVTRTVAVQIAVALGTGAQHTRDITRHGGFGKRARRIRSATSLQLRPLFSFSASGAIDLITSTSLVLCHVNPDHEVTAVTRIASKKTPCLQIPLSFRARKRKLWDFRARRVSVIGRRASPV